MLLKPTSTLAVTSPTLTAALRDDKQTDLTVDLSKTRFSMPGGLVAVACLIEDATENDQNVTFIPPGGSKPHNTKLKAFQDSGKYLYRMELASFLANHKIEPHLPSVRFHDTKTHLIELRRFSSPREAEDLSAFVFDSVSNENGDDAARQVYQIIAELADNAIEHSKQGFGFMAMQRYPRKHKVEFCIGDIGIGLRASLSESYDIRTDAEAIHKSVQRNITSTGMRGRGQGLADLIQFSTETQVICGQAIVTFSQATGNATEGQFADARFPGTLINTIVSF